MLQFDINGRKKTILYTCFDTTGKEAKKKKKVTQNMIYILYFLILTNLTQCHNICYSINLCSLGLII